MPNSVALMRGPGAVSPQWARIGVVAAAALGVAAASLLLGTRLLGPGDVVAALFAPDRGTSTVVVRQMRLPRTLIGLCVGGALGMAGAITQATTRNRLADPGLLGISAGAALAVVVAIQVGAVGTISGWIWAALAGAAAAAASVMALSRISAGDDTVRLVVVGMTISSVLVSLTSIVVLSNRGTLDVYRQWIVGSVTGRELVDLGTIAPFLVAGTVLALVVAPMLDTVDLGADLATTMGLRTGWVRAASVVAIVLLAGGATALCGPIAFVGLAAPHVARRVVGVSHRHLVPCAALVGAGALVAADVLGRLVVRPAELSAGIVVGLVGGPVFVVMARRAGAS